MKKIIAHLIILTILTSTGIAEAAFNRGTGGAAAANFLRLGAGARYLAMGETGTASATDVNALYWNPGNLGGLERGEFTLMQNSYVGSNYQFAGLALPTKKLGSFGASFQRLSAGDIRQTDGTGTERGKFTPRDTAVGLGWGHKISSKLSGGFNAKYVQSKIVDSASTWAFDAGLGRQSGRLSTGLAVRNMGGKLEFENEANPLPLTIQTGAGYNLTKNWLLSADVAMPQDAPAFAGIGTEVRLPLGGAATLALRGGYNTRDHNIGGAQGLTAGMGMGFGNIDLDYAWVPMGDMGSTHRFSLNLRFSQAAPPPPQITRRPITPMVALAPVAPSKPAPTDGDHDGVTDDVDACPMTPSGMVVDVKGCPADQARALPKGDWILRKVQFDFGKAELKPESMRALDEAVAVLEANPSVKVEVQGHTDAMGTKGYNLTLSERRAMAVKRYLMQEGIPEDRLTARGYGVFAPVAGNDTEHGRALNRRMEFKILPAKETNQ